MSGHATPLEDWRWEMAERFGWSLEYIDNLSVADQHEYWQVMDGRDKAAKEHH